MVQSVRLALSGVSKDGDYLEELTGIATQSTHKLLLILHLRIKTTISLVGMTICYQKGWNVGVPASPPSRPPNGSCKHSPVLL